MKLVQRVASRHLEARTDRQVRAQAEAVYRSLIEFVRKVNPTKLPKTSQGNPVVMGKLWWDTTKGIPHVDFSLRNKYQDSEINFVFALEGNKTYHTENQYGYDMIVLGVEDLVGWDVDMSDLSSVMVQIVKDEKSTISHEIVHFLDRHRMGRGWEEAGKSYKTPDQNEAAYYNHPLELNAYFIQAYHEITQPLEDLFRKINPSKNDDAHQVAVMNLWEWYELYGVDFKKFRDLFWRKAHWKFKKIVTPDNRKRLDKRLYDSWYKLKTQSRRVMDDLIQREDESALLMES
jgi:hypothetical protein